VTLGDAIANDSAKVVDGPGPIDFVRDSPVT
jgi:hypothetical protein